MIDKVTALRPQIEPEELVSRLQAAESELEVARADVALLSERLRVALAEIEVRLRDEPGEPGAGPTFAPVNDQLLVRRDELKQTGRILTPEQATSAPLTALVVAVGPGRILRDGARAPVDVRVGDRVAFRRYVGEEVIYGGEPHLVLRESDVLGILS
jgi:chaperonin GroES